MSCSNARWSTRRAQSRNLRIGIIGFTTPQIVQWDQSHLTGRATTIGIVEAARCRCRSLRAPAPISSSRSVTPAFLKRPPAPGEENAAPGAFDVDGIDAIVTRAPASPAPGRGFSGLSGRRRRSRRARWRRPPSCRASGAAISASSISAAWKPGRAGGSRARASPSGRSTIATATSITARVEADPAVLEPGRGRP